MKEYTLNNMKKTIVPSWHNQIDPNLHINLQEWLAYSGSFMQRLQSYGIEDARVCVLSERWEVPEEWERTVLNMDRVAPVLIREVSIESEDQQWMFARAIIPSSILQEKPELSILGTRPLGSVLFADSRIKRSEFNFTSITPLMLWYQKISYYMKKTYHVLPARRSLFYLKQNSLLLTEVFFPDIMHL